MTPDVLASIHAEAMRIPAPWSARDFEGLLSTTGAFLVPAKQTAGFALGRTVLDEAELLTIAIRTELQRQGFGELCLALFENEAIGKGAVVAHLEVAASNRAARGLYEKCGWTVSGHRRNYYRTADGRIDAILMQKKLILA